MALDRRIVELYDEYTHKPLDRRIFMNRLLAIAGSAAAAEAALALLEPNYASAQQIAPDDARIAASRLDTTIDGVALKGYLVTPKAGAKRGGVLVIHENRGLNPHIRDVARRLALEGFVALAPDFLSPQGGTPENEDKAREMFSTLDMGATVANGEATRAFLAAHEKVNGKVGAIGFCWGGGMVNRMAVASPELGAGVAYYGSQVPAEEVPKIKSPLLLHYAGLDERINAGIDAYRAALEKNGKTFEIFVYDGVNHAFNNDTSAARYDKAAADLAWSRTVEFLKKNLG